MTATSPFYRAVTPAPRVQGHGRRRVLVERPPEPFDIVISPEESSAVAESAEVAGEHASRSGVAYGEALRRRYGEYCRR